MGIDGPLCREIEKGRTAFDPADTPGGSLQSIDHFFYLFAQAACLV